MIDLGSGGGFPAIPLKIMRRDLSITLVDSSKKKASFLKHVIRILALKKASVLSVRIEELMKDGSYRSSYDYAVSRATFKLSRLLPFASYFLSTHGFLICMKGRNWKKELEEAQNVIDTSHLQLQVSEIREITLPLIKEKRVIVIIQKNQ
jgi:16S rRNA (guanine527-N7)-methyltransferase